MIKNSKRTAILEGLSTTQARPASPPPQQRRAVVAADEPERDAGLFGIALLRVAEEWSDPRAPALAEVIHGVAERMGLPPDRFELFVAEQLGRLVPADAE